MAAGPSENGLFNPIGKPAFSGLTSFATAKHKADNRRRAILSTDKAAIDVRGVSKVFKGAGQDEVRALDNVFVAIKQNEFFTLLGPSGCGKTTLLRLIAGFDFPTDGEILLYGDDIAPLPPFKRPVNTVFQNYALFPHMTVAQNIGFGLEMLGKPKSDIKTRVEEMLQLVRMSHLAGRKTSQISGGQQQRVALARALAPKPKVLLLDEPLSALDFKLRKDMQIELKRLQTETGITFIFVTHDQEEALTMSDRIAVMNQGKILQVGSPQDIYVRPAERFVANFIGDTNFLKARTANAKGGKVKLDVAGGGTVDADMPDDGIPVGDVTVIVRPEHASITALKDGNIAGTVENIVYFGTDTHVHLKLMDGSAFIVRQQNATGSAVAVKQGQKVGIAIAPGTARIIKD
jgi:spermidine/putrescine transport system ATP-binding protein